MGIHGEGGSTRVDTTQQQSYFFSNGARARASARQCQCTVWCRSDLVCGCHRAYTGLRLADTTQHAVHNSLQACGHPTRETFKGNGTRKRYVQAANQLKCCYVSQSAAPNRKLWRSAMELSATQSVSSFSACLALVACTRPRNRHTHTHRARDYILRQAITKTLPMAATTSVRASPHVGPSKTPALSPTHREQVVLAVGEDGDCQQRQHEQ
eukprot:m.1484624 g.1484624  ORF g.1484624 m.1484624 type:complete len:211 (+) comp25178_c0_seq164:2315-2947(+)